MSVFTIFKCSLAASLYAIAAFLYYNGKSGAGWFLFAAFCFTPVWSGK